MTERYKINSITIDGFKSIGSNEHKQTIPLGDVTVVIGANGAGK